MSGVGKRQPIFFRTYATKQSLGPRFDKLSKADWADVFCLLHLIHFPDSTAEQMMENAEGYLKALRDKGQR